MLSIGGRDSVGAHTTEALKPHVERLTGLVGPTGHFVAEEAPDWFVRNVREFLATTTETTTANHA